MDAQRAKELLPIIQAFADGKQIQFKSVCKNKWEWKDVEDPQWFDRNEYRVKPEPKEVWVNEYLSGHMSGHRFGYATKSEADHAAGINRVSCSLYREVIED